MSSSDGQDLARHLLPMDSQRQYEVLHSVTHMSIHVHCQYTSSRQTNGSSASGMARCRSSCATQNPVDLYQPISRRARVSCTSTYRQSDVITLSTESMCSTNFCIHRNKVAENGQLSTFRTFCLRSSFSMYFHTLGYSVRHPPISP